MSRGTAADKITHTRLVLLYFCHLHPEERAQRSLRSPHGNETPPWIRSDLTQVSSGSTLPENLPVAL